MTKEEIVTALLDDMEMPYLQDWQARDIVDFVLKKYTEGFPTIKGWVARNIHGTLRLYGNDAADGMGIKTGELPSPYKELTAEDAPIEVELTIHRV